MCDSSWHHYTVSLTPGEAALYVDGHLVTARGQGSMIIGLCFSFFVHVSYTLDLVPLYVTSCHVEVRDGGEFLEDWSTEPGATGDPTLAVGHTCTTTGLKTTENYSRLTLSRGR